MVCRRWGGTVIIPADGVNAQVLEDLARLFNPVGIAVTHAIGGARAIFAATSGVVIKETLTFKERR